MKHEVRQRNHRGAGRINWERTPRGRKRYSPVADWDQSGFHYEEDAVIKLSLYSYGLESLPELVTKLRSLRILFLVQNNLTSLPESIGDLKFLKQLWLPRNKLETLPYSIGNLRSLKYLNMGRNNLKTLPISIGNLQSLEVLLISSNEIENLPISLLNLKSFRYMDIAKNPIREDREYFGKFPLHVFIDYFTVLSFLRRKREEEIKKFKRKFEENEKYLKRVADGFIVDFRR
ncbi:MAG: hypothetical protein GF329_03720 [Candidatus Lokiarchaeota archaeon]|nr:hypothetical protein [Candidatus Lokiarchaeota archaeon]